MVNNRGKHANEKDASLLYKLCCSCDQAMLIAALPMLAQLNSMEPELKILLHGQAPPRYAMVSGPWLGQSWLFMVDNVDGSLLTNSGK